MLNVGRKSNSLKFKDISLTKTEDANGFTTLNLSSKLTKDKKLRKKRKKRKRAILAKNAKPAAKGV